MTRETKAGLLMILMLSGVFGFMVYKRMQHPAAAMAQNIVEPPSADSTASPSSDAADPFASEDFDRKPSRVVTAAATAPAPIPEDDATEPPSKTARSSEAPKGGFEQFQATNRAKTKLPTSIDDDFGAEPKTTSVPVRNVSAATPTASDDSFDPFSAAEAPTAKATVATGKPAIADDADPFDAPAIEIPAKAADLPAGSAGGTNPKAVSRNGDSNDPFDAQPAVANDGFEAPVVVKEAPRSVDPKRDSDPFDTAADLEIQRPEKPSVKPVELPLPANRRSEIAQEKPADIAEFEVQVPANPKQISEPRDDDPFDTPPASSSVPTLTIPSRDIAPVREPVPARGPTPTREVAKPADDGRFGGFVPATAKDATANAFTDQRPTATASPTERRATRPAPVAQIDEDFRSSARRPLVAGDTYDIEPGDNFWTISRKKYGTGRYFMALAQHNAQVITDPKRMRPGVTVSTPAAEVLEKTYAQLIPKTATIDPVQTASISPVGASSIGASTTSVTLAAAEENGDSGFFIGEDGTPMYRIGREDTLSGVAQRHLGRSSRWTQIFELNRDVLPDGNSLKIGAVLRLPADASHVDVVERGRTFR